jgi:hypothetical protein
MANHTPIVMKRKDWRITKAMCSCGAELSLGKTVGSPKEQSQKLEAAFAEHKKAKEIVHKSGRGT